MISLNIMDVFIWTDQWRNHNSAINFVLRLMTYVIYAPKLGEHITLFLVSIKKILNTRINFGKPIALT